MNSAFKMMNYAFKMMNYAFKMMVACEVAVLFFKIENNVFIFKMQVLY